MKSKSKSELAKAAGVSRRTLYAWLQTPYMQQRLTPLKLRKHQHILPPEAVKIICEHYVIETN